MKRFSRNLLAIILSDAARRLLGFFAVAYLARHIGRAGFGAVNVGLTALSYAMMVSTAGLNSFGTRAIAKGANREIVPGILSLRFLNALGAAIVLVAVARVFVTNSDSATLIMLFSISLLAHAVLLEWFFQGIEDMRIIGAGRILSAATYLLLLMVFVRSAVDIRWVAVATIAGDFVNAGLLYGIYRRRYGSIPFRIELTQWRPIMKQAFPLGSGSLLAHMSVNSPALILGIMMTNADVGMYVAAGKLVFFLLMFDRVLGTLLLPASARFYSDSPETLAASLSVALKWILVVALPLAVGGTLLSGQIMLFVFGEQYGLAAPIFCILVWYFFFTMIHTVYTSGLIAIGQEKVYGKVMLVSAALFFSSVILFTYFFGLPGTAVAVVCSEAATLILMRRSFSRFVKITVPPSLVGILIAGAVMGLALFLMPPLHVLVSVLIGGCVYALMVFLLRAVTTAEVSSLLRRI